MRVCVCVCVCVCRVCVCVCRVCGGYVCTCVCSVTVMHAGCKTPVDNQQQADMLMRMEFNLSAGASSQPSRKPTRLPFRGCLQNKNRNLASSAASFS